MRSMFTTLTTSTVKLNMNSILGNTQPGERERAWAQGRIKYEHTQAMHTRRGGEERRVTQSRILENAKARGMSGTVVSRGGYSRCEKRKNPGGVAILTPKL